jgi:hypothetical protein
LCWLWLRGRGGEAVRCGGAYVCAKLVTDVRRGVFKKKKRREEGVTWSGGTDQSGEGTGPERAAPRRDVDGWAPSS